MTHSAPSFLLFSVLLVLAAVQPVSASTISFSNVNWGPDLELEFYTFNGSTMDFCGLYNTTSTAIPLNDSRHYMVVVRPSTVQRFSDPASLVTDLRDYIETNYLAIILGACAVALVVMAGRRHS